MLAACSFSVLIATIKALCKKSWWLTQTYGRAITEKNQTSKILVNADRPNGILMAILKNFYLSNHFRLVSVVNSLLMPKIHIVAVAYLPLAGQLWCNNKSLWHVIVGPLSSMAGSTTSLHFSPNPTSFLHPGNSFLRHIGKGRHASTILGKYHLSFDWLFSFGEPPLSFDWLFSFWVVEFHLLVSWDSLMVAYLKRHLICCLLQRLKNELCTHPSFVCDLSSPDFISVLCIS